MPEPGFIAVMSPVGMPGFTYPEHFGQRPCDDGCGADVRVGPKIQAELEKDPTGIVICYYCARKRGIQPEQVTPMAVTSGTKLDLDVLDKHLSQVHGSRN